MDKPIKAFKPMLSATCEDITAIRYPALVSPKLDGYRCLIREGVAVSRNLKPIRNAYVQARLKGLPDGLDGELIVGPPFAADAWNKTSSGITSEDGEPDFTYWVFDWHDDEGLGFAQRYANACAVMFSDAPVKMVDHVFAESVEKLAQIEDDFVRLGYEGVMIRDPHGLYKFGRSTVKEGGLMKLKRWQDAEAIIVDMVERMHNGNEATKDELGRTKRSTHKANKTGRGDMGALICDFNGIRFELGTGFDDNQRRDIWMAGQRKFNGDKGESVIGRVVTFKYQALTPDGIPRFPVFKGFRDEGDLP